MLIVDVFNVLHADGILPPELVLHDISDLVWLLERSRYSGTPKVLVCDGLRPGVGHTGPSATRIGESRVLYSGAGREADFEIERLIEGSSFPAKLVVVSSDRRIARAAKKRRTGYLKSETFLGQLAIDADRRRTEPMPKWVHEIPLPRSSVEHWLETFGIDEHGAATLGGLSPSDVEAINHEIVGGAEQPRVPPIVTTTPHKMDSPKARGARKKPANPPKAQPPDEELRRLAIEQGLDPDDLDMERWLDGQG